jgi:hypothetical protein
MTCRAEGGCSRGRRVDIVFAVYLQARRPPIPAVLDADTDEILGRPELVSLSLARRL